MATEIALPLLGENVEGGEVLDLKAAVGDEVREGQALVEVEAEKSAVEVPSPVAGRISEWRVKKGDKVKTGQTLCVVEGRDGQGGQEKKEAAPARSSSEPEPKRSPAPNDSPETKKTKPETRNGPGAESEAAATEAPKSDGAAPAPADKPGKVLVPAGPATRRLAREMGIDLALVAGSAASGRVTQEDVKLYVKQLASTPAPRGGTRSAPPLPDFERWGSIERKPLEPVRRRTAAQMSLSWALVPHVTQHDQADVTELEAFRKQQDGKGPKLTITAFALKAVAVVLREMPQFNASLDEPASQLIVKRYIHLGVAVDTERGLLVPVVRDADKKSVHVLATELADLAERARDKKLQTDAMRGGTFTITNLGGIGGTGFTPIVNYPEVAILGLSRGRWQPVVREGQVVPRLILPLSLSYDHRVIDGADAARFARRLADLLENPLLMVLHA